MADQTVPVDDPTRLARTAHVCESCGYGISLARAVLPHCPMCRATTWVPEPDLPLRRLHVEAA